MMMAHNPIGGQQIMTTPNGNPTGANPARPRGYSGADAQTQANPSGGGQFTGGSEATVIGTNQDNSSTGAADASGAQSTQKAGMSMPPGDTRFTADD